MSKVYIVEANFVGVCEAATGCGILKVFDSKGKAMEYIANLTYEDIDAFDLYYNIGDPDDSYANVISDRFVGEVRIIIFGFGIKNHCDISVKEYEVY